MVICAVYYIQFYSGYFCERLAVFYWDYSVFIPVDYERRARDAFCKIKSIIALHILPKTPFQDVILPSAFIMKYIILFPFFEDFIFRTAYPLIPEFYRICDWRSQGKEFYFLVF